MHEQLDGFYTRIRQFITAGISYPKAIDIINASYTQDNLKELLMIEDPRFSMLVELASLPELRDLLMDFCQIVPDIATKPLNLSSDEKASPKNLIEVFKEEAHSPILDWLKRNSKTTSKPEAYSPKINDGITHIQNDLISLIEANQYKRYERHLRGLPRELIYQTIHQVNADLIDALLGADAKFICSLIELDASILQIIDFDQRVLDSLCETPDLYHNPLTLILGKYKDTLTPQDLLAVETALQNAPKKDVRAPHVPDVDLSEEISDKHATKRHRLFVNKHFKRDQTDLLRKVLLKQTYKSGLSYPGQSLEEVNILDETSEDSFAYSS